MTDNDLYQKILGLTPPWRVSAVDLRIDDEQILVRVVHDRSLGQAECPACRNGCPGYHTSDERRWRHLDTCQLETYLVCSVPRVNCPEHGVHVAHVPWSDPGSRFTSAFETQVHDPMHRAVERGLGRRDDTEAMTHLGVDEKSIHRRHSYMTVLTDTDNRRVVDMVEDRTLEAAKSLLSEALGEAQKPYVASVSMDMWQPFRAAQESVLPDADHVHDRFHISGYLSEAVDRTRRSENSRLRKRGDRTPNKTKYVWLKNPENSTPKRKETFESLAAADLETPKVWAFEDTFEDFFECADVERGAAFFANWLQSALALGNEHLTKVATMLSEHRDGLLNYLKHQTNNAIAEALNGRIQHIEASAGGYRRFQSFRTAVLFHLGKLDLYPQESL